MSVRAFREDERLERARQNLSSHPISTQYQQEYNGEAQLNVTVERLQERWERVEHKKTAITVITGVVLGSWLAAGVLGNINRLPLLPNLFTFVGLVYSGNFFWRYVLFKEGREDLRTSWNQLYNNLRDAVEGSGNNPVTDSSRSNLPEISTPSLPPIAEDSARKIDKPETVPDLRSVMGNPITPLDTTKSSSSTQRPKSAARRRQPGAFFTDEMMDE